MQILLLLLAAAKDSRPLQIGIAILAGMLTWHGWQAMHDNAVRKETLAHVDSKAKETAKRGAVARQAAAEPGAVERLRAKYCEGGCK